jgi:hypothetical protein
VTLIEASDCAWCVRHSSTLIKRDSTMSNALSCGTLSVVSVFRLDSACQHIYVASRIGHAI